MTNETGGTPTPSDQETDTWTSVAPSTTPSHSNIDSAPISSSYAPAPKAGGGDGFGTDSHETNPYAGTGYDTLGTTPPPGSNPLGSPAPGAPTPGSSTMGSPTPGGTPESTPATLSGQGGLADLYRAENNPYSDRSGRPISAVTPDFSQSSYTEASTSTGLSSNPYAAPASPGEAPDAYLPQSTQPAPSHAPPVHVSAPHSAYSAPPQAFPMAVPGSAPPKSSGTKGISFAIIGIAAALIVALFVIFGLRGSDVSEPTSVVDTALKPGACLESMSYSSGNQLRQVPCETGHRVEVIENITVEGSTYIGENEMVASANQLCTAPLQAVVDEHQLEEIEPHVLYPSESTWEADDRKITCLIGAPPNKLFYGSHAQADITVR